MADQKPRKIPPPLWAWPFAIACFAIPVITIGGAIPTAIGVGGGVYCLGISRELSKAGWRRVVHCSAMTAGCWILFMIVAGGVLAMQERFPDFFGGKHAKPVVSAVEETASGATQLAATAKENILESEATRKEIYAMATRMRDSLERARDRRHQRRREGRDISMALRQIEHIQKMQESQLEFATKFYDISREELEEIIREGDSKLWPTG